MKPLTVLIVEDHYEWQQILSEIVSDLGCLPHVADSYQAALTALNRQSFALATIDVSLIFSAHDNRDGVAVLQAISASTNKLPTIIITGHPSVELAVETLADLKALHFFQKNDFQRSKLIEVMKSVLGQGENPIPLVREQALNAAIKSRFSQREIEVLYGLSAGQTNQEIADTLMVSVNTVKKHVQSIFTKLNVNNRTAAVSQAFNVGRSKNF